MLDMEEELTTKNHPFSNVNKFLYIYLICEKLKQRKWKLWNENVIIIEAKELNMELKIQIYLNLGAFS
jgi:hypothetical protein